MTPAGARPCPHGNVGGTCPENLLCQARLGESSAWETHMGAACDSPSSVAAWRAQVVPVLRKRGYRQTRVIRVADLDA